MTPPEQGTSFGELRRAAVSFFCALCVLGVAALFWSGDTGLFHYLAILPGMIALLLVYNGFHALFGASTPPTTVRLPDEPFHLGGKSRVIIRQAGQVKLSSFRANLVCERIERKSAENRTIAFPIQVNFLDVGPLELGHRETKEFEGVIAIPADAEPSCESVSVRVRWRIEAWGKLIGRADFMRPFEIEVIASEALGKDVANSAGPSASDAVERHP